MSHAIETDVANDGLDAAGNVVVFSRGALLTISFPRRPQRRDSFDRPRVLGQKSTGDEHKLAGYWRRLSTHPSGRG